MFGMITNGSYKLGPDNATLSVRTRKGGAAAKAGHDLLIDVTNWSAKLTLGNQARVDLSADGGSLKVIEGTGGITTLGDDDKAGIRQTIDEEVLKGTQIEFHSTAIEGGNPLTVMGELDLAGQRHPITFELRSTPDGRLAGSATVKQSTWGIKPYSALFGTLKVHDEVTVEVTAQLSATDQ